MYGTWPYRYEYSRCSNTWTITHVNISESKTGLHAKNECSVLKLSQKAI